MGCRGATPRPGHLFRVRYLGTTSVSLSRKQLSIGVLQRPLLELYSAARRRGDDHRRGLLTMNQQVDVSDYGLVVAENEGDTTVVTKVITPISNVTLWAAVRFHSKSGRKNTAGAAFVPIACSVGVVDPKWYVNLGTRQRFLISLTHPSLFACVLRRVASPKSFECHAFVCATAEDALTISSVLGSVKEQCGRLSAVPSSFIEGDYYRGNPTNSDLVYTEDDTVTDVTVPHSPLTLSSMIEYRKSDVLDDQSRLMSSMSDSTCVTSDCKTPTLPQRNRAASPRNVVTVNVSGAENPKLNRETMILSKSMDFESESGLSSRYEPVPPPRRRQRKPVNEPIPENVRARYWQEELSETIDFSSESDLSAESDTQHRLTLIPAPSVTTDSEIDYRITTRRSLPLRREPRRDEGVTTIPCFNSSPETNWSSSSNHSPHQLRSATLPRSKPKTKAIRWRSEEPQRPSFLVAIKKFSVRSFGRAKSGTGKLINSFRTKFRRKTKNKDVSISEDSAYDTPEVCLSPNGSTSVQKTWKYHQDTGESSSGGHYVVSSSHKSAEREKPGSSSGSNFEAPKGRRGPQRKRKKRRRRWKQGPRRSSSDSGVEEYLSDYSDTLNSMQKSESELEHFATKVSMVSVEHGMSPDEFRQWSKTNLQEELGYIP